MDPVDPVEPVDPADPVDPTPDPAEKTYTVKTGDCLWSIAQQIYGTGEKWNDIYKANTDILSNPNLIRAGQVLKLPAA